MEDRNNNAPEHWVIRNLLGAAALIVGLALVANILLGIFTHHNKVIRVPDLTNMSVAQAQRLADSANVRIEIADSVYVRRMEKGAVFRQVPKAGSIVKSGRRIQLTTNAVIPKKVPMPNLVGYNVKQAKAELASRGLTLRKLKYVEDIATNNVIKQLYLNNPIPAGKNIESGSDIDLVLGLNHNDSHTSVPEVIGQKYLRAVDIIQDNYLNVGKLSFDNSVKTYSDSLNAVVYRQSPSASNKPLEMGSSVALSLTVNPEKMPKN